MIAPLFVRKLVAPIEVKLVLSAVSEEARTLRESTGISGPALAVNNLASEVTNNVLQWSKDIKVDVHNGKPPRVIALYLIADVARDHLASGRFHIHRGKLTMQGQSLRATVHHCYNELARMNEMTPEEAITARKATDNDIQTGG